MKTVVTVVGPVEIEVPRDREGAFESVIVRKRQRRLDGIDQIVLSLSVRGLPTGEISAHFGEVYGASVSKDTISRITDSVVDAMTEWQNRRRFQPVNARSGRDPDLSIRSWEVVDGQEAEAG